MGVLSRKIIKVNLMTIKFFVRYLFPIINIGFLYLLSGCSSAGKDIHFRSRLPTQETPLIKINENLKVGFDMDLETSRFTFQPTDNLVNKYHLDNNIHYFSDSGLGLNGFDISLNIRKMLETVALKGSIGGDFIELQFNPSELLGSSAEWMFNINVGYYMTSAFVTTSSDGCNFMCFTTGDAKASDQLKENGIQTSQSGNERKVGALLGYWFSENNMLTLSYQWMDYNVNATVTKTGSQDLFLNEKYYASGYGLGYFRKVTDINMLGITADYVEMHFRDQINPQAVLGGRMLVGF